VTGKKARGGFAAKIAVDALLIDVEFADDVVGPLVLLVSHGKGKRGIIER
jgi:hypothetical protein